jgi:aminoglycoside phosphotransferase (APT) family kinase protein
VPVAAHSGDPACDLAIAWTLLTAEGRQVFRERLCAGEAEWSRGRGWALCKTLVTCARTLDGDDEKEAAAARRALGGIFSMATRPR